MNLLNWRFFSLFLGASLLAPGALRAGGDEITTAVKQYGDFRELSPSDIKPEGWIREFLIRQEQGLTGNYRVQGYPFTINFWSGEMKEGNTSWWPYEQSAYRLDGSLRLGLLLNNQTTISNYESDLKWVINHPVKDGQLGPSLRVDASEWPMAVFFKSVIAYQLAKYDATVNRAFEKHYLDTPVSQLSVERDVMNVEGMLRTYEWTGNRQLLEKAEQAYQKFCEVSPQDLTLAQLESGNKVVMHGVTFCEEIKIPVLLYIYTGEKKYLNAAVKGLATMKRDHLLVDGVPSSNEFLATRDPSQSHETCVVSDFTYSLGYFLMATGDANYADMIERAIFNGGCGSVSKDFKSFQYFASVNQVIANRNANQNAFWRRDGETKVAFSPDSTPMCCAGNVHRFMPNYAARMWLKGENGGLVAALYGPSHVEAKVGTEQRQARVDEETDYPFGDTVKFSFTMERKTAFGFTLRIPNWCSSPEIKVNGQAYRGKLKPGTFVTISRTFQNGDNIEVHLPMTVKVTRFANSLSVERGPLLYAYAVPETVKVDQAHTKDANFPTLDIRPNGPWNYALDMDETNFSNRVRVLEHQAGGYPLDVNQETISMQVPVRRVKGWRLEDGRRTPPLPVAYGLEGQAEMIELIPYASTRLRIAAFPETVAREELPVQKFEVAGAYPYDRDKPISKQVYPPESTAGAPLWSPAQPRPDGVLELKRYFPVTNQLAYVRAVIASDTAGPAMLALNAKDACEVRLNGKVIHIVPPPNQLEHQFPDWIPVHLRQGNNQIQLKVGQYGNLQQYLDGWGVQIRCVRDVAHEGSGQRVRLTEVSE